MKITATSPESVMLQYDKDFFTVWLDNVNVSKKYLMTEINEDEGYIEFYVTDDEGKVKMGDSLTPMLDRVYGNVVIKFKK